MCNFLYFSRTRWLTHNGYFSLLPFIECKKWHMALALATEHKQQSAELQLKGIDSIWSHVCSSLLHHLSPEVSHSGHAQKSPYVHKSEYTASPVSAQFYNCLWTLLPSSTPLLNFPLDPVWVTSPPLFLVTLLLHSHLLSLWSFPLMVQEESEWTCRRREHCLHVCSHGCLWFLVPCDQVVAPKELDNCHLWQEPHFHSGPWCLPQRREESKDGRMPGRQSVAF